MSKVLIYNDPSTGNLTVVKLAPNSKAPLEQFAPKDGTTEWHIVDETSLPTDRTYRNAWKHDGGKWTRDDKKALEIKKARLREERAPKLAALDVEYVRADEAGDMDAKKRIAKQKQELRDATKSVTLED